MSVVCSCVVQAMYAEQAIPTIPEMPTDDHDLFSFIVLRVYQSSLIGSLRRHVWQNSESPIMRKEVLCSLVQQSNADAASFPVPPQFSPPMKHCTVEHNALPVQASCHMHCYLVTCLVTAQSKLSFDMNNHHSSTN